MTRSHDDDQGLIPSKLVRASDGLPARPVKSWAQEKLFYIERYVDIFTTAMKTRWPRRVYIDLFAGPGRSVVEDSGEEIDGSPLLALNAHYPFTDLYLNDQDSEAISALRRRASGFPSANLVIRNLDCNEAAVDAIDALSLNKRDTLGLAVIDPTAFQISFEALETMTRGRRIDLIITVMTGFLKRFIDHPSYQRPLDQFFGSPDWRTLMDLRAAGEKVTFRALLDSYEDKLRTLGYMYVDDDIRILNSRESTIYHLVFASKHPRGAEFFKKISRRKYSGQGRMGL